MQSATFKRNLEFSDTFCFQSAFPDCDWPAGIPRDGCYLLEKVFKVRNQARNQMGAEGAQLVGGHGLLLVEKLVF